MLEVSDIEAGYGEMQVLWDVSLRAEKGALTVLLGSNGAGKTTTLRTISGVLTPWRGRIVYDSTEITRLPAYKRVEMGIVMVPEGRRLWPHLTVYEHLELGASTKGARNRFRENLELVYNLFPILKERRLQLAGTLSGGEQQMLAIARALMSSPHLLLMDEPSLGLAPKLVIDVFRVIERLKEEVGLTIFLTEQNVHMALRVADYGYVMEQGRIVLEGAHEELEGSERIKKAYLGV